LSMVTKKNEALLFQGKNPNAGGEEAAFLKKKRLTKGGIAV